MTLSTRRRLVARRWHEWTARPVPLDRVANHACRSFDTGRKTVCRVRRRLRGALDPGGSMRRSLLIRALVLGVLAALLIPSAALAQDAPKIETVVDELNTTWVIVAGVLVMFMQAGFLFLELGFTRGKNVGTMVAKILVNFSIASIVWWAVGFALAFGGAAWLFGDSGFF